MSVEPMKDQRPDDAVRGASDPPAGANVQPPGATPLRANGPTTTWLPVRAPALSVAASSASAVSTSPRVAGAPYAAMAACLAGEARLYAARLRAAAALRPPRRR